MVILNKLVLVVVLFSDMKPNPGLIEDIFTQIIVIATEIYPPHMKERHLLVSFNFRQALRALHTTSHVRTALTCPQSSLLRKERRLGTSQRTDLKYRSAAHGKLMIKLVDQEVCTLHFNQAKQ